MQSTKKFIKGLANKLKICEKKLVWLRNMRIAIAKVVQFKELIV
jgi:hypothetical protein